MPNDDLSVLGADNVVRLLRSEDPGAGAPRIQIIKVGPTNPTLVAGTNNWGAVVGAAVFVLTKPAGATQVQLSIDGAPVRMRDDMTDPTASVGTYLADGFVGELSCPNAELRFIRATGVSANLNGSWRKYV